MIKNTDPYEEADDQDKKKKRKNAAKMPWYRGDDVPGDHPGHGVYKTKAGPIIRN